MKSGKIECGRANKARQFLKFCLNSMVESQKQIIRRRGLLLFEKVNKNLARFSRGIFSQKYLYWK